MSEIGIFSQVGVGVATLIILYVVVKFFTQSSDKKDTAIVDLLNKHYTQVNDLTSKNQEISMEFGNKVEKITSEFANTINNYIKHDEQIRLEQVKKLEALGQEIRGLTASNTEIANAFGKQADLHTKLFEAIDALKKGSTNA